MNESTKGFLLTTERGLSSRNLENKMKMAPLLMSVSFIGLVSCSTLGPKNSSVERTIASESLSKFKIPAQCSSPEFYIVGNASFDQRIEITKQQNATEQDPKCEEKLKAANELAWQNYEAWVKEKKAWGEHYSKYNCRAKGGCFAAGTKVHTESGWINIEDLRVGDVVRAYDHKSEKVVLSKVIKTRRLTKPVCKITVGENEILATPDHPFFSIDQDRYLPIGNLVKAEKNQVAKYSEKVNELVNRSVSSVDYVGEEEVFDIRVEKYHNFFIDGDILVHNW